MLISTESNNRLFQNISIVSEDRAHFNSFLQIVTNNNLNLKVNFNDDVRTIFEKIKIKAFDVVIIDIDEIFGQNLLQKLCSTKILNHCYLIVVGSKNDPMTKIKILELGVDDYLTKPVIATELVARIKSLLRCAKGNIDRQTLTAGDIRMNLISKTLEICNRTIKVSSKEFSILRLFVENPQKVFTREEILSKIWNTNDSLNARIVDVHINRLRLTLGSNKHNRSYVRTVRGLGYSLDGNDYEDNANRSYVDYMSSMNFMMTGSQLDEWSRPRANSSNNFFAHMDQ